MKEQNTLTLEQFKLICISDEEITDAEASILMKLVVLESEDDVREFVAILEKYRPVLAKEFFVRAKIKAELRTYSCLLCGTTTPLPHVCPVFYPELR